MATRRIKSFSPYSYGVQYAKAGEGPLQKPRPYVNMAILPEEHFVIAKQDPNWFAYMANTVTYSLDGDCSLTVDEVRSEISIVGKAEKMDDGYVSAPAEVTEKGASVEVSLKAEGVPDVAWASQTEVKVSHWLNAEVDCVVLADGELLNVSKEFCSPDALTLRFQEGFRRSDYGSVRCVIYEIGNGLFPMVRGDGSQVSYDRVNGVISIENVQKTDKCVAMLFDGAGRSYVFSAVDLTPNRILFDASRRRDPGQG